MPSGSPDTDVLTELRSGTQASADRLVPLLYGELRAIAHHHLAIRGGQGTLQTTALVHEAYLKLVDQSRAGWRDRAHFLALSARTLTWKKTKEAVFLTAKTTAMVCWLFVGSALFSAVFALLGGQALVERWVLGLDLTPIQFMLLSQAIIFLLGWPLEWTEIIIIFVPIFLPLLKHFDIDPVVWGVLVFVNLQAAFLSPPVAMSAFYLKGVSPPHVTINQIFAGMMPYMLIVVLCMVIMYIWPGITLWLPNYLYGS